MPARSSQSWCSTRHRHQLQILGRGEEALASSPRPLLPFEQAGVARWTRPRKFFGTINHVSRWVSELGRSTSPLLDCQAFKAPLSPRRGFTFGADRAAAWFAEPNVLKSDFD